MPNRIIKESICTSETIDQLTAEEERLFYRLIVKADDYGRFDGRAAVVRSTCFPLRVDDITTEQVEVWLQRLATFDLIRFYEVDGRRYIFFPTWETHQQKRAKHSKYPQPPARKNSKHTSASTRNHMQSDASNSPRETRNEKRETRRRETDARECDDQAEEKVGSSSSEVSTAENEWLRCKGEFLSQYQAEKLQAYREDGFEEPALIEAIQITCSKGKHFDYVEGILRRWREARLFTLSAIEAHEQKRERDKSDVKQAPSRAAPEPSVGSISPEEKAKLVALMEESERNGDVMERSTTGITLAGLTAGTG